ncbi:MAG: prolyl oligopeptidase family serine peptidase [Gemmatimonadota bacterium]|nr:prolyl oligopeptidase family serine peptidase [Gemmatimonadota bacterium]
MDDYHGTRVADPYRWLEDTDAADTKGWVEAQNRVTFAHLASIPERERIRQRLTQLWNYPRFGVPFKEGGRYFLFRNTGLQNQSVLYVHQTLADSGRVLLDPNTLSPDGTVALSSYSVSEDGRRLAYGVSSGGSDWVEIRVRDVAIGRDLADTLKWVKFSGMAWTHDNQGFFYSRYAAPTGNALTEANKGHKLYYHRVGTPQSADVLVWERPDQPEWYVFGQVSDDGRYLVVTVSQGTDPRNRLYYVDLGTPSAPRVSGRLVRLLDEADAMYNFVGNDGPVFYLHTDLQAPRARVIAVDTRTPARAGWRTVIAEAKDALQGVGMVNDQFVASYLQDAASRIRVFARSGAPVRDVPLPTLGAVSGFAGDRKDTEAFYAFTSFLYPTTIFRHDFRTGESTVFRAPKIAGFDPSQYETRQVFYTSKDGTRVPMFITHRKGMALDGNVTEGNRRSHPTLLYAYGGFNVNITPAFSVSNLAWLEMGGVYAVANLRGGAEYGEEWHQAGMRERKQNVFDDFIAAAEHLVRTGVTSPKKLAIAGGSNGGLLVGAVMNQRPDLFAAALPAVGVMDMLRYHKFTVGWGWVPEYGSSEDPKMFPVLHAYSPLHNLKPETCYPATLVTTADHDDRVVPGHSFKYAAALQAAQGCDRPTLIRIETRAGHGAGKPTSKQIEEAADRWAFLVKALDVT